MKLHTILIAAATFALAACGTSAGGGVGAGPAAALAPLPWAGFYQKATEEFGEGRRDEAVTLFYVGQLRGRIIVQCMPVRPDAEPALFGSLNETVGRVMNEYAGGSPDGWAGAIDRALAFDQAHPDPNATGPECGAERERQRQGLTQLRDQIRANVEMIRRERTERGLPNR